MATETSTSSRRDFTFGEATLRLDFLAPDIVRVRKYLGAQAPVAALVRYGFCRSAWDGVPVSLAEQAGGTVLTAGGLSVTVAADGRLNFADREELLAECEPATPGPAAAARFKLAAGQAFFGLGDQTRERLDHRGTRQDLWVRNVTGYIPIPFFWTPAGYGLVINTTRRVWVDLGATDDDWFGFDVPDGALDYYFLRGRTPREILARYTDLTGRPALWPKWSMGLFFVCRTQADAREFAEDCRLFRSEGYPCDAISLEPGWMATNYDASVDKDWHQERFPVPRYARYGRHLFLHAARRMGFKPGLWLCNDYDLSYEEERRLAEHPPPDEEQPPARPATGFEDDEQLNHARRQDRLTKPDEPWYKHLSDFVDQGVDWFKQDGAYQVLDHPDRLWGNGMRDDEMHNLYPLLYSRQMYEGYLQHTGRRPFTFTPAGWAGLQRWTATWTGDTGGEEGPLGACLNLSLTGHGMSTPDMEVTSPEGVHFGFLLPWSQLNSWNYFRHPWYQGERLSAMIRDYDVLRYRMIPYLYSVLWEATTTGYPMLRAMPLEYPDAIALRNSLTQYLLGPALLVGAFTRELQLPEGDWYNFWTESRLTGPGAITPEVPDRWGGPLLVRAGAILPYGPDLQYVGQRPDDELTVHVYAGGESSFTLFEDDGLTPAWESGRCRTTLLRQRTEGGQVTVTIDPAEGTFDGAPESRRTSIVVHAGGEPVTVDLGELPVTQAVARTLTVGR